MSMVYDWSQAINPWVGLMNQIGQQRKYQDTLNGLFGQPDVTPAQSAGQINTPLPSMSLPGASVQPANPALKGASPIQMQPLQVGGGNLSINTPATPQMTTYNGPAAQALGQDQTAALLPMLAAMSPQEGMQLFPQLLLKSLDRKQTLEDQQNQWQNAPYDLSPGQHRFINGKDVASVAEETPTVLTADQAAQKGLPPLPAGSFYKFSPKEGVSIERSDPNLMSPAAQKQRVDIATAEATGRQNALNPALPPGASVPGVTGDPAMHPEKDGYTSKPIPGTGGMTQGALDQGALYYAMNGHFPPNMGMSNSGPVGQQKNAIRNRASEMDPTGNFVANAGQVKALSASLVTQTKTRNQIGTTLDNAQNQGAQIVNTFSGKVNNDIPLINVIKNAAAYQLDPGSIQPLKASLTDLSSTYSQVFARNGQVTDAVRSKANDIADGKISIAALKQVIDQMNAQGHIVLSGYDKNIAGIQDQFRGIGGGKPAPAAAANNGGQKTVVRTGTDKSGKKVVQYSDGSVGYAP